MRGKVYKVVARGWSHQVDFSTRSPEGMKPASSSQSEERNCQDAMGQKLRLQAQSHKQPGQCIRKEAGDKYYTQTSPLPPWISHRCFLLVEFNQHQGNKGLHEIVILLGYGTERRMANGSGEARGIVSRTFSPTPSLHSTLGR